MTENDEKLVKLVAPIAIVLVTAGAILSMGEKGHPLIVLIIIALISFFAAQKFSSHTDMNDESSVSIGLWKEASLRFSVSGIRGGMILWILAVTVLYGFYYLSSTPYQLQSLKNNQDELASKLRDVQWDLDDRLRKTNSMLVSESDGNEAIIESLIRKNVTTREQIENIKRSIYEKNVANKVRYRDSYNY